MPSTAAVGIAVVFTMLIVAGVIYYKFDKAAVYVCTYGQAQNFNPISGMQEHHLNGTDNLKCYVPQPNQTTVSCDPGYSKTTYKGDVMMSKGEFDQINADSLTSHY